MPENPYAFPWRCDEGTMTGDSGMTLRDWFAGQALTILNEDFALRAAKIVGISKAAVLARNAYAIADAMLEERAQGTSAGTAETAQQAQGDSPQARSAEPMRPDATGGTQ